MNKLISALLGFVTTLRFPWLVLIAVIVLIADLLIPDVIPLADEIFIAMVTAMLASFKKDKGDRDDDDDD